MIKRLCIMGLSIVALFLFFGKAYATDSQNAQAKRVLYLNSYHEGYKWSDDILEGIRAEFIANGVEIQLDVEYMDTRRITKEGYIDELKNIYSYKYYPQQFDLIILSDDAAFAFLNEYGEQLFGDVPMVFCGVNYFEDSMIKNRENMTGIIEGYDIGATLDIAMNLDAGIKKVYYINDKTITGISIQKEFEKVMKEYADRLDFERIDGANFSEIVDAVKSIPQNSMILFLIYFEDNEGNIFKYNECIAQIEQVCNVPIYGVWDFHLGYGILGGKLTSGYYQGSTAAKIAIRFFSGENAKNIPIITEKTTSIKFDYDQIRKFNIPLTKLPLDSYILNHQTPFKKRVLILHSYNKGIMWTDDIEYGIKEALGSRAEQIDFSYEYMDVKKNSDPIILHKIREFLKEKYMHKSYDVVITTDDEALRFVSDYYNQLFKDTPVVFCGVSNIEEFGIEKNFTGVLENSAMKETIELALYTNPLTQRIVVINDETLSGKNIKKNLDMVIPEFENRVSFEFWSDMNMTEIQENVKTLGETDIILLLLFNQDKSYNTFSHEESIRIISEKAAVPIYGLWDFYLGKGLTGGMLISGNDHGRLAGAMVAEILDGNHPAALPIIKKDNATAMFDYFMLDKNGINLSQIPKGSVVINRPNTFSEFINNNETLVVISLVFLIVIFILFVFVYLLMKNIKMRKMVIEKERHYALTDPLTGVLNRRACFDILTDLVEKDGGKIFTIAFLDIDGLKQVNDRYGHLEGDELIKQMCRIVAQSIHKEDILFRMGGDEFLIIFKDASLEKAKAYWTNVLISICQYNNVNTKSYLMKVSAGFVEYDKNKHNTIDELIDDADDKMYKEKQNANAEVMATMQMEVKEKPYDNNG